MASMPVPADGSRTVSPVWIEAAWAATNANGSGVENCCIAWLSDERRVCVGMRPARRCHIASLAIAVSLRTAGVAP